VFVASIFLEPLEEKQTKKNHNKMLKTLNKGVNKCAEQNNMSNLSLLELCLFLIITIVKNDLSMIIIVMFCLFLPASS
jgi:hypothetical protein